MLKTLQSIRELAVEMLIVTSILDEDHEKLQSQIDLCDHAIGHFVGDGK